MRENDVAIMGRIKRLEAGVEFGDDRRKIAAYVRDAMQELDDVWELVYFLSEIDERVNMLFEKHGHS